MISRGPLRVLPRMPAGFCSKMPTSPTPFCGIQDFKKVKERTNKSKQLQTALTKRPTNIFPAPIPIPAPARICPDHSGPDHSCPDHSCPSSGLKGGFKKLTKKDH